MNNVTAIIVSYNTRDLLRDCYNSIRRFYPTMTVIIIDGSTPGNECCEYAKSISREYTVVKSLGYNIGHGKGMKMGIDLCKTEYFLLVDSDVAIKKEGVLERMLKYINLHEGLLIGSTYGCGPYILVRPDGTNIEIDRIEEGLPYLHPHFALIRKSEYIKYPEIINHGAPMLNAMNGLKQAGKIFIPFFELDNYIYHAERGTRKLNPKEFHPKNWDKI